MQTIYNQVLFSSVTWVTKVSKLCVY